jgi:hypothetical protein
MVRLFSPRSNDPGRLIQSTTMKLKPPTIDVIFGGRDKNPKIM